MKLENEILVNKFGQELVPIESLQEVFNRLDTLDKKTFLNDMVFLIMQSKATDVDIEPAIEESKLKKTYTPCIQLRKGVAKHNLIKIVSLPDNEMSKVYILFLNLFKIAYKRRFEIEKGNPDKWWYWDLSDENIIKHIK